MASNSSIIKTFIYGDIFDYPLTKEEIWKFLIGKKVSRASFEKELNRLATSKATPLGCNRNFYFFSGREEIVEKRIQKKKESQKKLALAKKIIQKLSLVPTVLFIGISGGLALENAQEKDDIDLFVITSKNTLWITRLILVLLLIMMEQYRGRGKKESQKICLNMLIDETALDLSKLPSFAKASAGKQNLYTAHEIVQLKPAFDRNSTYQKFINANKWVDAFLSNAMERIRNPHFAEASRGRQELGIKERKNPLFMIHNSLFVFEKFAKALQLWYMKKHRTKETIENHFLAFHPFDYKSFVLKEYNNRLKRYGLI